MRVLDREADAVLDLARGRVRLRLPRQPLQVPRPLGRAVASTFELRESAVSGPIALRRARAALGVARARRAPLADVREAVLALRRGKGMVVDPADPDSVSAGSFFTNPILDADAFAALAAQGAPGWPEADGRVKTSAAWLIQRAGFDRGYARGRAAHLLQAHARARQPRRRDAPPSCSRSRARSPTACTTRFGVELHPEPVLVGRGVVNAQIVGRALAAAFEDDPHMRWVFRSDRLSKLQRGYPLFIERFWAPHGEVHFDDPEDGAAVWLRPGEWHTPFGAQLRATVPIARIARGDLGRLLKASTFIERRHPKQPHWYLPMIGVAPHARGRGLGSSLLQRMLDRCDAEGSPAYLEASSEKNRPLYERHGFVVTDEWRYAPDAPPVWPMWREPAAPACRRCSRRRTPPTASIRWLERLGPVEDRLVVGDVVLRRAHLEEVERADVGRAELVDLAVARQQAGAVGSAARRPPR